MSKTSFLFMGLGNPGPKYDSTRHNIGFWVIDRIAGALSISLRRRAYFSIWGDGSYLGHRLLLAKPQTYMNQSGQAAAAVISDFALDAGSIWIIHDDLDLPAGRLRLRLGGGSGGHRGVQSIIDALGHRDFGRIRVGIGRPPAGVDPADYVLAPLDKAEKELLSAAADRAAEAALAIIAEGLPAAMSRFNQAFASE